MHFHFKITKDLLALCAHSLATAAHQLEPYTNKKPKEPSLVLVKDSGVYLLSPYMKEGHLGLMRKGRLVCAYAEGHGENTWLSGDDFAFALPVPRHLLGAKLGGELIIRMTEKQSKRGPLYNFNITTSHA